MGGLLGWYQKSLDSICVELETDLLFVGGTGRTRRRERRDISRWRRRSRRARFPKRSAAASERGVFILGGPNPELRARESVCVGSRFLCNRKLVLLFFFFCLRSFVTVQMDVIGFDEVAAVCQRRWSCGTPSAPQPTPPFPAQQWPLPRSPFPDLKPFPTNS